MVEIGFYKASDMTRQKDGQGKPSLTANVIFNMVTMDYVANIRLPVLHKQMQALARFCTQKTNNTLNLTFFSNR